ncbi:MAG: hypothetical protein M3P10_07325 [Actinomycetota bacterium]|nr:hypothetical protein [Actinomycetota bacterium]
MRRSPGLASVATALAVVLTSAVLAPAVAGAGHDQRHPADTMCGGLLTVVAAGRELCTHGGDGLPDPSATTLGRATSLPKAPCPGNGVSGRRVRVFYGYPKGTIDRFSSLRDDIQLALRTSDSNLDAQTPDDEGQHYRFWCETDVVPTIRAVRLKAVGGDGAYSVLDVIDSLVHQRAFRLGDRNFTDGRFAYVTFVDHLEGVSAPAGQATFVSDDDPDPAVNQNNGTSQLRYAMVTLGFTTLNEAHLFQHEVGHTMGAVQLSSPHSSGAVHCYDAYDIMCYDDGGPYFSDGGTLLSRCPKMPDGQDPWDCGGDDWYAVDPSGGNYLVDHWNVADSGWLSWAR